MGAQLFSSLNNGALLVTAVILGGCAGSAPPLPTDTTSANAVAHATLADFSPSDAALSCAQIQSEGTAIEDRMRADNGKIEGNRTRNQIAGYFGALYLVPLVAMEPNDPEKKELVALYARRDVLIKLTTVKACRTG